MNLPNGWLHEAQAIYLAQLVKDVVGLNGSFLEVGSFHGRSSVAIGTEVKKLNGHLYCIDVWNKELTGKDEIECRKIMEGFRNLPTAVVDKYFKGDSYLCFNENIKARGLDDTIVPIVGLSSTIRETWKIPLRFIFIDGHHDYEYVRDDCLWRHSLVSAGVIAFHDYGGPHKGVKKAVDEIMSPDSNFKLLSSNGSIKTFRKFYNMKKPVLR